ncbi:alpha/beta fold hydrolase [Rhodococcus aetherivorans]|uniref:alpha/beta fold hydrolase n=1 Tax=Rhodococcus aetherivorans TaxID=191292 RepID=UPI001E60F292|nr:alpha/beta fold hydrolase [Rhodococcus aetherivorans]UGQ40970.1 alpha/beta hydrolase [Rhodococcus aetherivorans]
MPYRHRSPVTRAHGHHTAIHWSTVRVDDRAEVCGVLGRGSPVVFVPGWGLTPWIYRHALAQLARSCRVYAPAIPGFAGVPDRPLDKRTVADCAAWLGRFLGAAGLGPVTLVGHSFGGALAIRAAHDLPDRIVRLVLVNSVGAGAWPDVNGATPPLGDGPLWERGAAALGDALSLRMLASTTRTRPTTTSHHDVGDPGSVGSTDPTARGGDLTAELHRLAQRRLPVALVWSRGDRLVPWASVESLRAGLGGPPVFTVAGGHGWPITDPECFGHTMRTALDRLHTEVAS